ncbi:MAG TPA: DivIVA domain-containing protein [Actinomycetes bacterium]|jgi:DivIVA domain-containing protein|nr:DivIVA domain-containing protein [Actinomycetes bacterium]
MDADVRLTPEAIRSKAFKKVRRGYRTSEVGQFLGRVAQDFARLQERVAGRGGAVPLDEDPPLTPSQVQEQTFNGAWYGYAMHEVDDFLDVLVVALGQLHRALDEAQQWHSARRAPLQPPLTAPRQLPAPDPAAPRRPMSAHDVAAKTFSWALRGYSVDEVDQFLGRVAVELARVMGEPVGGPPRLSSHDIASKRFTLLPRGYAMHEVDDFLAQLAAQLAERESGWSSAELN